MAQFPGSIHEGAASIHTMVLNSKDTLLATGDNFGFVYLWNIDGYCMTKPEEEPAELLNMWRAHIESVTWCVFGRYVYVIVTVSILFLVCLTVQ